MRALRVVYGDGSEEYYCSVECANERDVCEGDGEWTDDYPNDEPCASCYIGITAVRV